MVFRPAIEKLEIVECDLENENSIRPAIGNASIVICCIGASEKEVFNVTGPYRIDYKATKNLIEAGKMIKFQACHCYEMKLDYAFTILYVKSCF